MPGSLTKRMKVDSYAEAIIPNKTTILGISLRDFSLGHWILMRRYGCAYASEGEIDPDIYDLLLGIVICSMTFQENETFFNKERIKFFSKENFREWITGLRLIDWRFWKRDFWTVDNMYLFLMPSNLSKKYNYSWYYFWKWSQIVKRKMLTDQKFNIFRKIIEFEEYLKEGQEQPLFFELGSKNGKARETNAHWTTTLVGIMVAELGYDRDRVMDAPLAQMLHEYYRYAEAQGVVELLSDYEEEMHREAMEKRKELQCRD